MNRFLSVVSGLALVVLLALPAEAKTTLRITLQLPIKSHLGQNLLAFEEEIEKATKGEIERYADWLTHVNA